MYIYSTYTYIDIYIKTGPWNHSRINWLFLGQHVVWKLKSFAALPLFFFSSQYLFTDTPALLQLVGFIFSPSLVSYFEISPRFLCDGNESQQWTAIIFTAEKQRSEVSAAVRCHFCCHSKNVFFIFFLSIKGCDL